MKGYVRTGTEMADMIGRADRLGADKEVGMIKGELNGRDFYACFVNGDKKEDSYPFRFLNEYELVEAGEIEEIWEKAAGFRKEDFIRDKLELTGSLQVYYATVSIPGKREAGKLGQYGHWYKITFTEAGAYSCAVQDYSAEPEEMFREETYRCKISALPGEENASLQELFQVYPDGKHIWEAEGRKPERESGVGTLHRGQPVGSVVVWHCRRAYYLCVEFYDANDYPIGLFDVGYQWFVYTNYSDQNMPLGGNWGNRVPITVIISHFHSDHVNGLVAMMNNRRRGGPRTFQYFFSNMELHMPDTLQTPSYNALVATVRGAGGRVTLYNDQWPFRALNAGFDYGLASFNHPLTNGYHGHPHLHGMYVRCRTLGGRSVLMVGDTVYRGIRLIPSWGNPFPHQGDLSVPYDVLIACHHGGDYAVGIAGNNLPANMVSANYIPIPGNNPVVIYSSNGNGTTGKHPHPGVVADHTNQGWASGIITNGNFNFYGNMPGHIIIDPQAQCVTIG